MTSTWHPWLIDLSKVHLSKISVFSLADTSLRSDWSFNVFYFRWNSLKIGDKMPRTPKTAKTPKAANKTKISPAGKGQKSITAFTVPKAVEKVQGNFMVFHLSINPCGAWSGSWFYENVWFWSDSVLDFSNFPVQDRAVFVRGSQVPFGKFRHGIFPKWRRSFGARNYSSEKNSRFTWSTRRRKI